MVRTDILSRAFEACLQAALQARQASDAQQSLALLERAHLIGQERIDWHWRVHCRMLALALSRGDRRETGGQLLRLALVPLGHLTGRLPPGNPGSTRVGAFDSVALPDDLKVLFAEARSPARAIDTPATARRWNWPWFLLAVAMVSADQTSKEIVALALPPGDGVVVTPFFNLVHVLNPGAAFSFLAGAGGWQRYALSVLGIAISLWLARELKRGTGSRLERFAYAMIIGGALGNVFDRLRQGAVTDFLDFHWQGAHWPAFNVADVAISLGATALIAATLRHARHAREEGEAPA